MRRSDYIFQSFTLRDRTNLPNVILSTTSQNQKFLPPAFSTCEHEFLYYAYVDVDPRTDFNVNAVWLGSGPPPPPPNRLNDIVNVPDWEIELSAPGFNPQLEGFTANVGSLYIIHYKPTPFPQNVYTIRAVGRVTNVTTTSIRISITALIDNVSGPLLNYFGGNAFYLCQVFTPGDTQVVYALQNNNIISPTSPLSGIDFDVIHNNHITITYFTENIIYQNTPNTPNPDVYNDPLGPINIYYTRVFARYAHIYSIRNSIDWTNNINYPGLYQPTLYIKFFPNKLDTSFVIEDSLSTYYPNQGQDLSPRPISDRLVLSINNVGLCSITRVGNVPFPSNNVYVYVLVLFDEADHALSTLGAAYQFVFTFTASPVSATEYQVTLPITIFSLINRPYRIVAGMLYLQSSNVWASVFSEPKDPPKTGAEANRFDVVFIGSSNRIGGLNIPMINIASHQRTALSARYSVFDNPVIEFPPHDSIYVNGIIFTRFYTPALINVNPAWTNATLYYNDFLRNYHNSIVNRASRLVYKMFGEDILGNRTLVYTYSSTFNRINQLDYYSVAFFSLGTFPFSFVNGVYKHTYLQDKRPVIAPLPLNAPTYYSAFSNNPLWAGFVSSPTVPPACYYHTLGYHDAVFTSLQATEIRAAVAYTSNASIRMLTNFTLAEVSSKVFALVFTIAVPLPRYINSFFYKQDRTPFGSSFTSDFVKTVHVLELYDNANTLMYAGEQVSLLNHQYEVDEPNITTKTLSVLDYEPLNNWQLSLDTFSFREYVHTCINNRETIVVTLYQDDVSENNILDVVYWNVADIPLLLNQQFNTVYTVSGGIVVHSPDHTVPLLVDNKISSDILSFDPVTNTLRIDKTKLGIGRFYVYFRGFHSSRRDINFYEFDYDYNPNQCTSDQYAGYYELDSFRIVPPPPDYDLSSLETDCLHGFMYLCNEQVRVFTAFQMTDLPQNTTELVFLDQFEQPKYYLYIFPNARVACGYSTKDWCGVEIVENFPRDTITIRYNVRGRIDDVEVYSSILQTDEDYECLSRFQGVLELNTDTVEEEQYITSITKEKRTIFRRYTLEYTLTLYLPNACTLGHLLLIKKAQYWIVESQNFYAFRVKVLPGEIQYRSLDGQKYLAIIKLREIRYPGEYRYPLR